MQYRDINRPILLLLLVLLVLSGRSSDAVVLSAKNQATRERWSNCIAFTNAAQREELPQDSDEVVKVETNLTNIFFTAADKNRRFITDLKAEDIRVLEDGQPQEIFTFNRTSIFHSRSRF